MSIERREIIDRTDWLGWRVEDVTASPGPCLLGDIHPYVTSYQLYALKSGLWTPPPINPKLARRGAVIEKAAPEIVAEERPGWAVSPNRYYYRDPAYRLAGTPDLEAIDPNREGIGNIQVKSVGAQAFRRWKDRDTGETNLPVWIAVQVNIEAHLMGATWAVVCAITIGDQGLDVEIIDVPLMPALIETYRAAVKEFWRRVEEKDPYPVDWGRDAATILDMFRDEDGSVIDLTSDDRVDIILEQREQFKTIEAAGAEAEKRRRMLDAELIHKLGNAAAARTRTGLIKAPTVSVKEALRKAYKFRKISVTKYAARDDQSSLADGAA
jgi:predicted phage-related endonuclease